MAFFLAKLDVFIIKIVSSEGPSDGVYTLKGAWGLRHTDNMSPGRRHLELFRTKELSRDPRYKNIRIFYEAV